MNPLNREKLRALTDQHLEDAQVLYSQGRWAGAYYLAGYSVECALKSCIAIRTLEHDFPDKAFANQIHTHEIEKLSKLASLEPERQLRCERSSVFRVNWQVVTEWSEVARYDAHSKSEARILIKAISDNQDGVLPWIKLYW